MRVFVLKEFLQIFRDKRTMIILFGIPVVQILLFGFALKNELKNAHIAILDQSKDVYTQEITNKLLSSGYFLLNQNLTSEAEIEQVFRKGKVREVIVFEPNFGENLIKNNRANVHVITDASDPNTANLVYSYTQSIINDYVKDLNQSNEKAVMIIPEMQMRYNKELKSVFMFVPGVITIILMLVSAMMTSISITREKELGTMEILLVSPVKPWQIIIGKVVPYVFLSFASAVIILLLSYYVFQMPFSGSLILLLGVTVLFIVLALSLGVFISTVAKTQQVAMLLSMFALLLPTILLSGFIFPIKNMPLALQYFSHLMPPKWFVIIIKNIIIKGNGLEVIWKEVLILLGMTIFFITLIIKKFKTRLE